MPSLTVKTAVLSCAVGLLGVSSVLAQPVPGGKKWDISNFDASKFPAASTQSGVTFDKDILPIFKASCGHCHGEDRPHGGFRVDSRDALLKGGHDGDMVVPGDSSRSPLVGAVARVNPRRSMPPPPRRPPPAPASGATNTPPRDVPAPPPPLTPEQVGLVRAWIDQGAK